MNLTDLFQKTPKGEEEISRRCHGLAPRARSLLIMVNGKVTGEELKKRSDSLGGGNDLFQVLFDGGFIEPMVAPEGVTAQIPVASVFGPAHEETVRFASRFIVDALGPAFDELGGRVEACKDPAKLGPLLEAVRDVIEGNAGRKKAEAFWAGVTARLPV